MDTEPDPSIERLPRYRRHRFKRPALVMTDRDYQIIELVAAHRFITSDDLQLLVSGSDQTILRRLQKLFHNGYLDRPRIQRMTGNQPMVYALGQRGAEHIATTTGRQLIGDWSEKNRAVRNRYLEHGLMASRFQTALRHACDQNGMVLLEQWFGDGVINDSVVVEHANGKTERIPIRPDALFILNVLGGPQPGRVHVLLEADRGTMTVQRFVTKLRGYFSYWRSGQAAQRLAKTFLVVTTTTSAERAANLAKAARSVNDRGLRMFLFGPEAGYLPAVNSTILKSIWRSPEGTEHSLLE